MALGTPLAIYFSPADYLRITPSWVVPTLILLLNLLGLYWAASLLFSFILRMLTLTVPVFKRPRTEYWERLFNTLSNAFPLIPPESETRRSFDLLAVFDWAPKLLKRRPMVFWFFLCSAFYRLMCSLNFLNVFFILFFVAFFLLVFTSFLPGNVVIKLLLMVTVWCALFALFTGLDRYRYGVPGVLTRVLFESEKDRVAGAEGYVIFDLDRYLLLGTGPRKVVAIPHEKIKSIEAPPLPKEQVSAGD
jgi:hypothetical protein